jgi:hypothetical protein
MTRVRDLTPDDAAELTALYGAYEWCADRDAENVRRALADTEVAAASRTPVGSSLRPAS